MLDFLFTSTFSLERSFRLHCCRSLWAGMYLRNNAYARLYFLVYVTLLHAWLFVVISFKVCAPPLFLPCTPPSIVSRF